jgi:hypothetical protein
MCSQCDGAFEDTPSPVIDILGRDAMGNILEIWEMRMRRWREASDRKMNEDLRAKLGQPQDTPKIVYTPCQHEEVIWHASRGTFECKFCGEIQEMPEISTAT